MNSVLIVGCGDIGSRMVGLPCKSHQRLIEAEQEVKLLEKDLAQKEYGRSQYRCSVVS